MMKYEKATANIINISEDDIITTSIGYSDGGDDIGGNDDGGSTGGHTGGNWHRLCFGFVGFWYRIG